MRYPVYLLLISLINFSILGSTPLYAQEDQPSVLVLGDSLSAAFGIERDQGWVHLLQQHLNNNGHAYNVINASVSGDTTRAGLARLPLALKEHQPKIVIIALGGNDGLRGISLKEFRANLERMIRLAKAADAKVVLCGVRVPPNLGVAYVAKFLQVYREVSAAHNVPLVNYILKDVSNHSELMQADGIHPTAAAQPLILNNVLEGLNRVL
ncbi:MAG: arylesterase [Thioalkalispiraceae bacterium]|jgi:acyl-CoA thioesterase-1